MLLAPVLALFGMATLAIINARRPSLVERAQVPYPAPPYPLPNPAGQGVPAFPAVDGGAVSALIANEAPAQRSIRA